jgi:hypothetical protein
VGDDDEEELLPSSQSKLMVEVSQPMNGERGECAEEGNVVQRTGKEGKQRQSSLGDADDDEISSLL